jgi:uncharacterized repeat protein (TIGR01451 family)
MNFCRFLPKSFRYTLALLLISLLVFPLFLFNAATAANPPQPTYASANMNGDPSEWDLNVGGDFFAYMYLNGNVSAQVYSNVSLRYDCSTGIMYVLVMSVPDVPVLVSPNNAWGAIDSASNKVYTGNSGNGSTLPAFVWVGQGYDSNMDHAQGYEAAFSLAPGSYGIIVNVAVDDAGPQTSATAGSPFDGLSLVIECNPAPAIEVTKMISTDNATWVPADDPPGIAVTAGSDLYYFFNVTNTGNVTLSNIVLTDSLYSFQATPPDTLAANDSYLYFLGPVTAQLGQYTNTANATGTFNNTKYSDTDDANYIGTIAPNPAITVIKYVSSDNATWFDANTMPGLMLPAGDNVYYKYEVVNVGNVELFNLSLTDNVYSLSVTPPASLFSDGSFTYYYGPVTALVGQQSNTATATGQSNNVNYTDTDVANYFGYVPDIAVTKFVSNDNATWVDANSPLGLLALAGSNIYYQYVLNNTGNVELTHLSLTDNIYALNVVLPSTIAAGETFSYFLGPVTALIGQHTNTATASGRALNGMYYNATDDANYFGATPSIQLVKSISTDNSTWNNVQVPPGILVPNGTDVYFKFEITNTGNIELTNITLTDDTYTLTGLVLPSTLAPEEVFTYYLGPVTAQINQHTNNATTTGIFNNVTYYSDSHLSNYFGTDPSINVIKYVSSDNSTWVDANTPLGLSVYVGSDVYYKYVVNNTGNVELFNITLTDNVYTLGATPPMFLAADEEYTFYYGPVTALAGQHTNTASATGQYYNETYTDTDDANYYGAQPDISVVKQVSSDNSTWIDTTLNVTVGENVYFRYVVNNTGNTELTNLTLTDDVYSISPTLPSSLLFNETFTYYYGPITALSGLNTNIATATGKYDETTFNATDNASYFGINTSIDVIKQISSDNSTWVDADTPPGLNVIIGSNVYYKYVVNNTGSVELYNITLTDSLYTLTAVPPTVLAPNEVFTYYYGPVTALAGQHTNTANATGQYNDTNYSDTDDANYYGSLEPIPEISVIKQISTDNATWVDADTPPGLEVLVGTNLYFRYMVNNTGTVTLDNLTLTDNVYSLAPSLPATLEPNETYTYYYGPVTALEGQHTNTATATGDYSVLRNGASTVTNTSNANYFGLNPSINVVKQISINNVTWVDADMPPGIYVVTGLNIYYRFTVTNDGNVELTNITLTDDTYDLSGAIIPSTLAPDESFVYYYGPVTALEGQHTNTATSTGDYEETTYNSTNSANYLASTLPCPAITVTKWISADNATWVDANFPPGLEVLAGSNVYFKFDVNNTGNVELSNIMLWDSTCLLNGIVLPSALAPNEAFTYYYGPVQALEYQHTNIAIAIGTYGYYPVFGIDTANYYGIPTPNPSISITKYVSTDNRHWSDANTAPGLIVPTNSTVYFKYIIKNTGNVMLSNVTFVDDPLSPNQTIAEELPPGETITICLGTLQVAPLQNMNNGTVSAMYNDVAYSDSDAAYYYGSFCTYTANEYGGRGTAGRLLNCYFSSAFPDGLQVGYYREHGGHGYKWTRVSSLVSFLGCSGVSEPIYYNRLNPTNVKYGGGSLAVQVATLSINVALSDLTAKGMPYGFGDLVYVNDDDDDSLSGQTVSQILATANAALGGQPLPEGYTCYSLKNLIQRLNAAFDSCEPSAWALTHLTTEIPL